jgi:hypothetical protein
MRVIQTIFYCIVVKQKDLLLLVAAALITVFAVGRSILVLVPLAKDLAL